MSKFIFSILFLLCFAAEDVQGQNIPDESRGNQFLNRIGAPPNRDLALKNLDTSNPSLKNTQMRCHKCDHMNKEGKCLNGEGFCFPTASQLCMTKKVYEGGKLQYIVQGCEAFCWSMTFGVLDNAVQFECCQDKPLCNVP